MTISVGDRVRLRKVHPCGGQDWTVFRAPGSDGDDVGLECVTCKRRVLLRAGEFERRRVPPPSAATSEAGA